jgi:hypothetical protein
MLSISCNTASAVLQSHKNQDLDNGGTIHIKGFFILVSIVVKENWLGGCLALLNHLIYVTAYNTPSE